MSVKKLSFYIDTAKITVKSDHLPLKKFLEKNTLNSKVNNWAVELESQNITFEYIPGIRNTLADTLSRLIEMDNNNNLVYLRLFVHGIHCYSIAICNVN